MPTLDFKGKQIIYAQHLTVPSRTLAVEVKKSLSPKGKKPALDDNLIIHGDNLHALKALMPRYAGKVNCIYIDPPYNTGNEKWIYNDNVNSPMMKEWLKDKSPVDGEDLERHDKWLCMMWPRLQLLRELLAEDGVIFISIDDNEQHRLRMVMDEIFGEENFVSTITVENDTRARQYNAVATTHEYIVFYVKDNFRFSGNELINEEKKFKFQDNIGGFDLYELRNRNVSFNATNRPNLYYPFYVNTNNKDKNELFEIGLTKQLGWVKVYPQESQGVKTVWRWQMETAKKNLNTVLFARKVKHGYHIVKKYRGKNYTLNSVWTGNEIKTDRGTLQIKEIFGSKIFDHSKPIDLLSKLIMLSVPEDGVILDSFAGSATTAHATLALNKEDGGNRKFILVECEKYADKITAERVRRVIKGVPKSKDENLKNGLGGSFTYCTLGDEISVEKMLTGKNLPDYDTLARHVFYTATGQSPTKIRKQRGKDGFFYETNDRLFYLIYEPNLAFLRSTDSALNSDRTKRIAKQTRAKKKTAVVFATHKFMGQKELTGMGIVFCGLPYTTLNH